MLLLLNGAIKDKKHQNIEPFQSTILDWMLTVFSNPTGLSATLFLISQLRLLLLIIVPGPHLALCSSDSCVILSLAWPQSLKSTATSRKLPAKWRAGRQKGLHHIDGHQHHQLQQKWPEPRTSTYERDGFTGTIVHAALFHLSNEQLYVKVSF